MFLPNSRTQSFASSFEGCFKDPLLWLKRVVRFKAQEDASLDALTASSSASARRLVHLIKPHGSETSGESQSVTSRCCAAAVRCASCVCGQELLLSRKSIPEEGPEGS